MANTIFQGMNGERMSVMEFAAKYATVDACLEHLREVRWADGAYCPRCGGFERISHYSDGRRHKCGDCNYVFRLITGTIFADTPIKLLPKWFMAIYLDMNHSKGVSSVQLAKDIGVTQKTAWHMLQRIRHAAGNVPEGDGPTLDGTVEVDETYLGGKESNKHESKKLRQGRGAVGKQAVLGMKERGGRVHAMPVAGSSQADLHPPILANVREGATLNTDEHAAYRGLPFNHEVVRHGAGEYVRGPVHTNSIEGFWAMVKRAYIGVHHFWSPKHSIRYVDGCAFRDNHDRDWQPERVRRLIEQGLNVKMPYKTLVGAQS